MISRRGRSVAGFALGSLSADDAATTALTAARPNEAQALADALRLRGFAAQADTVAVHAAALPAATWPATNAPAPPGTRLYRGVAPKALQDWAYTIVHDPAATYGDVRVGQFGDVIVLGRVEHHSWSTAGQQHAGGDPNAITTGHYKGVTLYETLF